MTFLKIVIAALAMLQYVSAKGYGGLEGSGSGGFGGGAGGMNVPTPYATSFQAPDGAGGMSFRNDQGDGNGNVKGSYGYKDSQGLYRMVEYSAGVDGFRATVNTNEPGVDGKENPADVVMNVEKTPAGIQERYTRPAGSGGRGGYGGGASGHGGGAGGYGDMRGRLGGASGSFSSFSSGSYSRGGQGVGSGKSGY